MPFFTFLLNRVEARTTWTTKKFRRFYLGANESPIRCYQIGAQTPCTSMLVSRTRVLACHVRKKDEKSGQIESSDIDHWCLRVTADAKARGGLKNPSMCSRKKNCYPESNWASSNHCYACGWCLRCTCRTNTSTTCTGWSCPQLLRLAGMAHVAGMTGRGPGWGTAWPSFQQWPSLQRQEARCSLRRVWWWWCHWLWTVTWQAAGQAMREAVREAFGRRRSDSWSSPPHPALRFWGAKWVLCSHPGLPGPDIAARSHQICWAMAGSCWAPWMPWMPRFPENRAGAGPGQWGLVTWAKRLWHRLAKAHLTLLACPSNAAWLLNRPNEAVSVALVACVFES